MNYTIDNTYELEVDVKLDLRLLPNVTKIEIFNVADLEIIPCMDSQLTHLSLLSNWWMHYLPRSISSVKTLKEIYIRESSLVQLPNRFFELTNLEYCYLENNYLEWLPDGIDKCKQLKVLDVSRNRISEIPDGITALEKLVKLNISHNPIKSIPLELFQLPNLKLVSAINTKVSIDEINLYLLENSIDWIDVVFMKDFCKFNY